MSQRYLSLPEAAVYLGMTGPALRSAVQRRTVPFRRRGRRLVFDTVELDKYMSGLKGTSAKEAAEHALERAA